MREWLYCNFDMVWAMAVMLVSWLYLHISLRIRLGKAEREIERLYKRLYNSER